MLDEIQRSPHLLSYIQVEVDELKGVGIEFDSFEEYALKGFLLRIFDKKIRPSNELIAIEI